MFAIRNKNLLRIGKGKLTTSNVRLIPGCRTTKTLELLYIITNIESVTKPTMKLISISRNTGYYEIMVKERRWFLGIKLGTRITCYSFLPQNNLWKVNGIRKPIPEEKKAVLKNWINNHKNFVEGP